MEHIELFFKSIFIDNMVFATFLGMCSYLAVSKKVSTAVGLGAAVIFVMAITVPLNWLLDQYILQEGALSWARSKTTGGCGHPGAAVLHRPVSCGRRCRPPGSHAPANRRRPR